MTYQIDPGVSFLSRVKIQAEVLVPVLKALRSELGEDRANEVVYKALRDWSRQVYQEIGSSKTGTGKEKWQAISNELDEVIGDDVEFHYTRNDSENVDFDVTGCRFAEFFRKLGEPALGSILSCEIDDHVAELAGSEVEFNRPQTIMGGAHHCEFRYKFNTESVE
jgi:predicted ArsR family transcriptional regulator